jgi:release factor glutamine methyltransferase
MTTVSPESEAELVLALRSAGCVFAEDEAALLIAGAGSPAELQAMTTRRIAGDPLEVILGWAEFRGLRVGITPGVFVPRHRTEFLVERAIELSPVAPIVIDLCCGSGALGMAFAAATPGTRLFAADIEPGAAACARANLAGLGQVFEGDLFDPLPRELLGTVDLLLVNAPYVPTGEVEWMPPEARLHEPLVALDGGSDGLDVHRRVAAEASVWLKPGGSLLIEVSELQQDAAIALFERNGLRAHAEYSDDYYATVVTGTRPID